MEHFKSILLSLSFYSINLYISQLNNLKKPTLFITYVLKDKKC